MLKKETIQKFTLKEDHSKYYKEEHSKVILGKIIQRRSFKIYSEKDHSKISDKIMQNSFWKKNIQIFMYRIIQIYFKIIQNEYLT